MGWVPVMGQFAASQRAAGLSEKTITNRAECLSLLARMTSTDPEHITKTQLIDFLGRINQRTGKPISAGTKQSERSYLQVFFHWMHTEQLRADDPALTLPKVKLPRRQPRPFRLEQVDDMITTGSYARTRDIITIAAMTGLRVGEIVAIRGEDVDMNARVINTVRKGSYLHAVPMPKLVRRIAKRMPRQGWWFPSHTPNKEYPEGGGHILMKSASDTISRAMRRAGITDARLTGHSLRHYFATTLLREGVNIRVVQELLGHASLATTQLYTQVTEAEMLSAVAELPSLATPLQSGRSAA